MQRAVAKSTSQRSPNKRDDLIKVGVVLLTEKSFYNTSVDEIVAIADVPKGSFHYYFGTKNDYVIAVIQAYSVYFIGKLDRWLRNDAIDPIERIRGFTDDAAKGMARYKFKRGCLIGNLGQELSGLDERLRLALLSALADWRQRIKSCLDDGIAAGLVDPAADTEALARYFWNAWEGAVLFAKLEKSRAPLDAARDVFISQIQRTTTQTPTDSKNSHKKA